MNLHPLIVHFPIALFSLAFVFEIIEIFKKESFKNSSFLVLIFAILCAILAVQTGNIDAQNLSLDNKAKEILEQHQSSANFSLFMLALVFMIKFYVTLKRREPARTLTLVLFALYLLGLIFIYRTAYLGTKLVFEYSIGTKLN
jgi:uncharacterized membrane protein